MSLAKMNIPKTISVGYQNRDDTYTGKLAYVIYTDEKGVLRKETSWNSWRDEKINPDIYDNVPTSGFVLNKKVGDYRGGWDGRLAWVRIYDPRGFEFEISVENLLYILEECTSVKGKGLEGEFVYSWDGKDLVLLPVSSKEYEYCVEFTKNKALKVTKADMREGFLYLMKDMTQVMYMGRHDWYRRKRTSTGNNHIHYAIKSIGKKHVFMKLEQDEERIRYGEHDFFYEAGFTKIAKKISDVSSSNFAEKHEDFKKSSNGCKIVGIKHEKIKTPTSFRGYRDDYFVVDKDVIKRIMYDREYNMRSHLYEDTIRLFSSPVIFENEACVTPSANKSSRNEVISADNAKKLTFCEIFLVNENGSKFKTGY